LKKAIRGAVGHRNYILPNPVQARVLADSGLFKRCNSPLILFSKACIFRVFLQTQVVYQDFGPPARLKKDLPFSPGRYHKNKPPAFFISLNLSIIYG